MPLHARAEALRLAAALALGALVQCTLFNPLDHLQSGKAGANVGDASNANDGGANEDGPVGAGDGGAADAAPLSACPPELWTKCNVVPVVTDAHPGGITFGNGAEELFYTDELRGEVWRVTCGPSGCAPALFASGEDAPRAITTVTGSVFWTTATALRRQQFLLPPDAGPDTPSTMASITGATDLKGGYPLLLWTDTTGARYCNVNACSVTTVHDTAASAPLIDTRTQLFFVAAGVVKHCVPGGGFGEYCQNVVDVPGVASATALAPGNAFAFGFLLSEVPILAIANDGRDVVVSDHDDAGAPRVLAREPVGVRALATDASYVYWTTERGELRRLHHSATEPQTILHGLGSDTQISAMGGIVIIADRDGGRVLRVTP